VKDFHRIDPAQARVILLEGGPRVLAAFSEPLSQRTQRDLTALGVEVRTGAPVSEITADGVRVGDAFIPAKSVFWAAGVQAASLALEPAPETDRAGRIRVAPDLTVPGHRSVYVLGDMAAIERAPGQLVPGLAPAALQEGRHAARNLLATLRGQRRRPFRYVDKGQMATIGKNKAVVEFGRFRMTGHVAWLTWLIVHIFFLIGFKNRIAVVSQWAWSYLFSKRGARLITEREWKLK
jgi:NADH dehydrogenase